MWIDGLIQGFFLGVVFALLGVKAKIWYDKRAEQRKKDALLGIDGLVEFKKLAAGRLSEQRGTELRVLAVLDVDQFKDIKADHGEKVADSVLVGLGDILMRSLRGDDLFARIGRREFAIVFEAQNIGNVNTVLDRLRSTFSVTPTKLGDGQQLEHTMSIGYTLVNRSDPSLDDAMSRATEALDRAKSEERNCIRRVLPEELDRLG